MSKPFVLFRTKGAKKGEYVEDRSKNDPRHHQWLPSPYLARGSKYQVDHPSPERGLEVEHWHHIFLLLKAGKASAEKSPQNCKQKEGQDLGNDGDPPVGVEVKVGGQRFTVGIFRGILIPCVTKVIVLKIGHY